MRASTLLPAPRLPNVPRGYPSAGVRGCVEQAQRVPEYRAVAREYLAQHDAAFRPPLRLLLAAMAWSLRRSPPAGTQSHIRAPRHEAEHEHQEAALYFLPLGVFAIEVIAHKFVCDVLDGVCKSNESERRKTSNRAELLAPCFSLATPCDTGLSSSKCQAIARVLETTPHTKQPMLIKTDSKYSTTDWADEGRANSYHRYHCMGLTIPAAAVVEGDPVGGTLRKRARGNVPTLPPSACTATGPVVAFGSYVEYTQQCRRAKTTQLVWNTHKKFPSVEQGRQQLTQHNVAVPASSASAVPGTRRKVAQPIVCCLLCNLLVVSV
ncbi:hypothetical protein C8Q80DRAFT_1272909 [Daedaleopsis nitida]|nr:hypothetical protein C8Q80DRAFT_1272909 [Daedaleopsis nitida]